jgi:hypothetical protein
MARFGQGFIQGLSQPSYMQGLFNVGVSAGSLPGMAIQQKEKERREQGLLGGLMALEGAASSGQLTNEMLQQGIGSLAGLGMSREEVMSTVSNLRQLQEQAKGRKKTQAAQQRTLANTSTLGSQFVQDADSRMYDENIIKDVSRRIASGDITDLPTALDIAEEQTQTAANRDYYENISYYDQGIGALVARGQLEAADKRFSALKTKSTDEDAANIMQQFQKNGGLLNENNRAAVWSAVSYNSEDLAEATTTMARLEKTSLDRQAATSKSPKTVKITYIPKEEEGYKGGSLFDTSDVQTKQIDAPAGSDGKVDPKWFEDFKTFSAERIIGFEDPVDRTETKTDNQEQTGSKSRTPLDLANTFKSTAQR